MDHILILMQQGQYVLAEREIRRLLTEDPENFLAHVWLAVCLNSQDRHKGALDEAETAIGLEPDEDVGYSVQAQALLHLHELKRARKAIEYAIQLDPEDEDHYGILSVILHTQQRWQEALEAAEAGLEIAPDDEVCTNMRAKTLVMMGRQDEAEEGLALAMQEDPENWPEAGSQAF